MAEPKHLGPNPQDLIVAYRWSAGTNENGENLLKKVFINKANEVLQTTKSYAVGVITSPSLDNLGNSVQFIDPKMTWHNNQTT